MNIKILLVAILAGAAGWLAANLRPGLATPGGPGPRPLEAAAGAFQCPMHPWVRAGAAGQCTICGMNLAPAGGPAARPPATRTGDALVMLPLDSVRVMGVRTVAVAVHHLILTATMAPIMEITIDLKNKNYFLLKQLLNNF